MTVKYIVCDWNGTLFEPPTDEELNKAIAYARLNDAVSGIKHGKLRRAWDVGKLLSAKKQLKKRLAEYKAGRRPLAEVYEPFNRLVVNGMSADLFWDTIGDYATNNHYKLDRRMVEPLRDGEQRKGILSVSQRAAIINILMANGMDGFFRDFVSNRALMTEDEKRMSHVTLDIYGKKGEVFEDEFLADSGYVAGETVYAGDTEDDLPIADLLPRGHFVVPFYATDAFREMASGKYGAFVPKNQQDWADFLAKK